MTPAEIRTALEGLKALAEAAAHKPLEEACDDALPWSDLAARRAPSELVEPAALEKARADLNILTTIDGFVHIFHPQRSKQALLTRVVELVLAARADPCFGERAPSGAGRDRREQSMGKRRMNERIEEHVEALRAAAKDEARFQAAAQALFKDAGLTARDRTAAIEAVTGAPKRRLSNEAQRRDALEVWFYSALRERNRQERKSKELMRF